MAVIESVRYKETTAEQYDGPEITRITPMGANAQMLLSCNLENFKRDTDRIL